GRNLAKNTPTRNAAKEIPRTQRVLVRNSFKNPVIPPPPQGHNIQSMNHHAAAPEVPKVPIMDWMVEVSGAAAGKIIPTAADPSQATATMAVAAALPIPNTAIREATSGITKGVTNTAAKATATLAICRFPLLQDVPRALFSYLDIIVSLE
ncbi:hypothetical protein JS533_013500, partial [Bifidobacterium amazonense]